MAGGHVPMRMCVVCKRRAPKRALLRYAAAGQEALMPDPGQTVQGRGVYHCDAPSCREAFSRRLAKRKLKRQGV